MPCSAEKSPPPAVSSRKWPGANPSPRATHPERNPPPSATNTPARPNNAPPPDCHEWIGGSLPGPSNVAVWDNTVTAANSVALGADQSWAGIQLDGIKRFLLNAAARHTLQPRFKKPP